MSDFFKPINKVKKFEKASAGLAEWQKREIEPKVLVPDVNPVYGGPLPKHKCSLDNRCVRIVFPTDEDMEIVGKYLTISESFRGVKYITNLTLLVEFCKALAHDPALEDEFSAFIVASKEKGVDVDALDCTIPEDNGMFSMTPEDEEDEDVD